MKSGVAFKVNIDLVIKECFFKNYNYFYTYYNKEIHTKI